FLDQAAVEVGVGAELVRTRVQLRGDDGHPPILRKGKRKGPLGSGPFERGAARGRNRGLLLPVGLVGGVLRLVRHVLGGVGGVLRGVGGRLGSVGGSLVRGGGSGVGRVVDV